MKYKLLKDLYDCFYAPLELPTQKQEIEECHHALSEGRENQSVGWCSKSSMQKDRIAEGTSIDSFIAEFELAWKLSVELNHYKNERSISCRRAIGLGARFTSAREEEK